LVERLRGRVFEFVEDGALGIVRLDRLCDPLDWPIRQPCGLPAAEVGFDTAAGRGASRNRPRPTGTAARVIAASASAAVAARRLDRRVGAAIAVRVGAEHAVVEVVVGIGPERVIRIRIEGVVDEVVVGVRPEQRADKSDHDRKRAMPPPLRVEEAALERRVRQRARAGIAGGGHARKTLVAQNAAGAGARRTGRAGAARRLRNDAVGWIRRNHGLRSPALLWSRARPLILLNRMLLRSHVLLWSGAARLVLLNDPLLRSNVLLWRDVAAAVPGGGRCCCGSAGRASLRCHILPPR